MQEIVEFILSSMIMVITPIIFGVLTLDNSIRKDKSKVVVMFLISCIIYSLNYLYFEGNIKTIIGFILHIFIFNQIFNCKMSRSVFITFIYVFLAIIVEIIILFVLLKILMMSVSYCYNTYAGSLLSNFIICITIVLITIKFRKGFFKIFNSKLENSNNIIFISVFALGCVITLFFDIITNYKNNNNICSYIVLIIIFLLTIANLIKEKIEINDKIQEYNGLLGFMKSYEKEIEENKIQNHEIKNQFITVQSMVRDNTPKSKIIKYLDNIIKEKSNIDDSRYTDLQYLPLNGIKGFICNKLNKAAEQNLNVSVVIEKGVETSIISKLSTRDFKKLGILLGVYLDNAIEASSLSKEKYLGLEIYLNKKGVIIIITNTFENFIRTSEDNKTISTKGKGRGHGLLLVNKVLSGNKMFSVQSEVIKKVYIQKILVKKNKMKD